MVRSINSDVSAHQSQTNRFSSIDYDWSLTRKLINQEYSDHPLIQKIALCSVVGLIAIALFEALKNAGIFIANGAIALANRTFPAKQVEVLQPTQAETVRVQIEPSAPEIELQSIPRETDELNDSPFGTIQPDLRPAPIATTEQKNRAAGKIQKWFRKCIAIRTVQHQVRENFCLLAEKREVEKREAERQEAQKKGIRTPGYPPQKKLTVNKAISMPERQQAAKELSSWPYPKVTKMTKLHWENKGIKVDLEALLLQKHMIPVVVKNEEGTIEAAAAVFERPDCIYVDRLVTGPWNLDKTKGIKGAGTAVIEDVLFLCLRKNKPLKLHPIESAIPFYRKLGLEFIPKSDDMIFELKDISQFLKERGGAAHPQPSL